MNIKSPSDAVKFGWPQFFADGKFAMQDFRGVANTHEELLNSIENYQFNLDGRKIPAGRGFTCSHMHLLSLYGCPETVGFDFNCSGNNLSTLEYGPIQVDGDYYCSRNRLTNLKGAPKKINNFVSVHNIHLTSLEGAPEVINGYLSLLDCTNLTNLHDIHLYIKQIDDYIDLSGCPIESHILGLLKIKNLKRIIMDDERVADIINLYLGNSRDLLDCQEALIEQGYEEFAQL